MPLAVEPSLRPYSAAGVLNRSLAWSPAGTISSIADLMDSTYSQAFAYDAADRLTAASGKYGALSYSYDGNGNRTSETVNGAVHIATYQAGSNRMTLLQNVVGYTLDAAGNATMRGSVSYPVGADNRTAHVFRPDGSLLADYAYNGLGLRTKRVLYPTGSAAQYYYSVYDAEGRQIGEYNASGAVLNEYVFGPAGRVARLGAGYGDTQWHHNDHLGTSQALSNTLGKVVWKGSYEPFGKLSEEKDPDGDGVPTNNWQRFPGQSWDWESGTYYNYHRSYDPISGRYTQSDPIGLVGGMNTYGYLGGNPLNSIDPTGLNYYQASAQVGGGAAFSIGIQVDSDTGDVFITGGIGAGFGVSGSATYQIGDSPSEGTAWKFSATYGTGVLAAQGNAKWNATEYSKSGKHSKGVSLGGRASGLGTGLGGSVTGTFTGTKRVGNVGRFIDRVRCFFQ